MKMKKMPNLMIPLVALACVASTASAGPAASNFRPIIGVVSEPVVPENQQVSGKKPTSYIAASYVKYLEMAGARVVPIVYDQPADQIQKLLEGINGVLFPGGGASLQPDSPFFQSASRIFQFAVSSTDSGKYFPVWGTCLGFQFLSIMGAGKNNSILSSGFDSEDLPLPLNFTANAANSKLFKNVPDFVVENLRTKAITMNAHHSGVAPLAGANNKQFSDFYSVLSTNNGRQGKEFISTIEAKDYPIYGTQYHPEKINFEWVVEKEPIPHSFDAVVASQYFANFFVNEARKSSQTLTNENDYLIYNYNTNFTGKSGGYFTETYFF